MRTCNNVQHKDCTDVRICLVGKLCILWSEEASLASAARCTHTYVRILMCVSTAQTLYVRMCMCWYLGTYVYSVDFISCFFLFLFSSIFSTAPCAQILIYYCESSETLVSSSTCPCQLIYLYIRIYTVQPVLTTTCVQRLPVSNESRMIYGVLYSTTTFIKRPHLLGP